MAEPGGLGTTTGLECHQIERLSWFPYTPAIIKKGMNDGIF